ncbi:hypothetical protein [Halorubrum laminariae]|uniref:SRPBCC family protein n=1 Tax=Halorubrum laminariae TaxID=1433523 RepID=A0ABD6C1J8_9EURY|nr:hypothetical protein [Halorubrum laminariae]
MGLPGTIDSTVYAGLRDVLDRHPAVTSVGYEPDSISKEFVRATVAPARIEPPTGSESPVIEVEWRFRGNTEYYRIHYADPNTGFNCGWHRDTDHPDLGSVHFQYEPRNTEDAGHVRWEFEKSAPTEILWTALERLFETEIPRYTSEDT